MGSEETTATASARATLIFTYGTLKQGFPNHHIIEEKIDTGDATYLGVYRTVEKFPMVCGPYKVPFLLNFPGSGDRIWGELYAVSDRTLDRMDELEGITTGHYERLPIEIQAEGDGVGGGGGERMHAEAYYAHRNYAGRMWKKTGEKGCCNYSKEEADGYVRRKDRPQHISFLDQIQVFCSSESENHFDPEEDDKKIG